MQRPPATHSPATQSHLCQEAWPPHKHRIAKSTPKPMARIQESTNTQYCFHLRLCTGRVNISQRHAQDWHYVDKGPPRSLPEGTFSLWNLLSLSHRRCNWAASMPFITARPLKRGMKCPDSSPSSRKSSHRKTCHCPTKAFLQQIN